MGGLLKACGCYDGPWAPDDDTLVSVRCDAHAGTELDGHVPLRRNQAGVAVMVRAREQRPRMAIPKGRRAC